MKPDWQNKSYAKTGAVTGPSTTHPKLKIGMSSLHSKIAVANHNTIQAKMPAVRKFADGGAVTTRSDDEIGDTDPRTGKVDPGSYDRRMAQGEKNLQMFKDAFNKFTGEKPSVSTESKMSPDDLASTYYTGKKDSAKEVETKSEMATEPSYMKDVRETLTKPKTETTMSMPEETAVVKTVKSSAAKPSTSSSRSMASNSVDASKDTETKPARSSSSSNRMSAVGQSQKDIEARILANKGLAGNEEMKRQMEQASTTDTGDETARLRNKTTKSIPGVVGRFDLQGNQIPVGLGPRSSKVYDGDGSSAMGRAEKKYLQSRIDAGNMTAMEKAQAKRAGLI